MAHQEVKLSPMPRLLLGPLLFAAAVAGGCATPPKPLSQDDTVTISRSDYVELQKALSTANSLLAKVSADNTLVRVENERMRTDLARIRKDLRTIVMRIPPRVAMNVTRNMSSLPARVFPVGGAPVTVASTALDVRDACLLLADLKEVETLLGERMVAEAEMTVCGIRVPSLDELSAPTNDEIRLIQERLLETLSLK